MFIADFDEKLWSEASDRARARPVYKKSHRREAANEVGALGEVLVEHFLRTRGIQFVPADETTHDLVINGKKVEVKTKDRTVVPLQHYECSVPLYNHDHQRPSYYIFVSLLRDEKRNQTRIDRFVRGYILGWATLSDVDGRGMRREESWSDPANGTTFWTSCLNLEVRQLRSVDGWKSQG